MSFPKGMRLEVNMHCPFCLTLVKPVIISRRPGCDPLLRCPVRECEKEWYMKPEQVFE